RFAELRHQNVHALHPFLVDFSDTGLFPRAVSGSSPGHDTAQRIHQITDTYCVSWNSFMPSCAPSRPSPDCLVPPKGAAGSETRPRFKPIMPKSSFSDTRMPRVRSLV